MLSGNSVIATSNLAWMASITCWSPSEDTKVIAKPLVPNRPARLEGMSSGKKWIDFYSSSNPPNTVKVRVGVRRGVVVDYDVHPFDINAATENVGSDKDTFFEGLERGISTYTKRDRQPGSTENASNSNVPFLLGKTRVDTDTGKIARDK